jgi:NADH/NAD ratio-sensing transcriptional regulator Rex
MKDLFFINEDIARFENVIIYGAGWAGKNMLLKLLQRDIGVKCFADYDPEKCGTRLLNIPVAHIDELEGMRGDAAIIVSGRFALEVAAELEKRGWAHIFFDYGNEVDVIHLEREDA